MSLHELLLSKRCYTHSCALTAAVDVGDSLRTLVSASIADSYRAESPNMSGITTDSTLSESTFFSPFLYIVKGLYLGQVSSQVSGVVLLSVFGLNSLDRNTRSHAGHLRLSSNA